MPNYNANITFTKPYSKVADIVFAFDSPIVIHNVTCSITLPKPSVSIQCSRVSNVTIEPSLPKPSVSIQCSRVHTINLMSGRATQSGDIRATKSGRRRSTRVLAPIMLPKPLVTFYVQYDNNVWRGTQNNISALFDETNDLGEINTSTLWKSTSILNKISMESWQDTHSLEKGALIECRSALSLNKVSTSSFDDAINFSTSLDGSFDQMIKNDIHKTMISDEAKNINECFESSSDQCAPVDLNRTSIWSVSNPITSCWSTSLDVSRPLNKNHLDLFDPAKILPGAFWYRPTSPEPEVVIKRDSTIIFGDKLFGITSEVVFGIITPLNKIVSKRTYYMLHSFYLRRVSDNEDIQISKITANISQSDYTWGFDFDVIGTNSYNKLIEYDPMELELMINGWKWKLVLTSIKQSQKFGSNNFSATGLGLASTLSDRYLDKRNRTETSDMTIHQLAQSETNGTLFTLEWQNVDWLVPGNTYSYQDKTPIEALGDIASASGGYILPDREWMKLTIKPKYPIAPWLIHSLVPDLVIPTAPIINRDRVFNKMPEWNSVWVSGTTPAGIMASVTRTGTAGDRQPGAPITHSLITDTVSARARGIRYLGDHLSLYNHKLVLPLSYDVPLIEEGILIQVEDQSPWRGLVTGVGVNVSLSDRSISVRQTIDVEQLVL